MIHRFDFCPFKTRHCSEIVILQLAGRRELREAPKVNKYKTKLCQKYWVTGYCAYGPRCNFIHQEPPGGGELQQQQQQRTGGHRFDRDMFPTQGGNSIGEFLA